MAVLGIVAEYDPFHNGHLRHLREAVSAAAPSAVIVLLSGPFKQRGETAMLSPFTRAQCALMSGADAVFAPPVLWTVRDAEHYALGTVHLLSSLGATHLAFGAETADLPLLQKTAALLENPPAALKEALHASLAEGCGYPAALAHAAGICIPESESLLGHPNNVLAVCYLRAIRRLGLSTIPVVIPRLGAYHGEYIIRDTPSASALRSAFRRGAWEEALAALPPVSGTAVRKAFLSGSVPDPGYLDTLLVSKLRSMLPEQAALLPDCREGLGTALQKAAAVAGSREEIISLLTTRRYSSARISRLCTYALLGITDEALARLPLPNSVLLLALKKNPLLTGSWKNGPVHIADASRWAGTADSADLEAWRLWSLACGLPDSYLFTQKLVTAD